MRGSRTGDDPGNAGGCELDGAAWLPRANAGNMGDPKVSDNSDLISSWADLNTRLNTATIQVTHVVGEEVHTDVTNVADGEVA